VRTLAERLRDRWVETGVPVRPGVSWEDVRAFESRCGVRLPPDLRDFYMSVDGMESGESDPDMLEFLRLAAVVSVSEGWLGRYRNTSEYVNATSTFPDPARHFLIADFMIASHVYAIRLGNDAFEESPVFGVGIEGEYSWPVADSFTEFGEKYLAGGYGALI
jgi:SMI1 / KNR4 family (SUKH-1)